jgi:ABC-type sugar transport system ATPase subunit
MTASGPSARAAPTPRAEGTNPLVSAHGITRYFGGVVAVNDITLDFYPGEVVALVGDNGAGKSTFVKLLSGIHQPDRGTFMIGGEPAGVLTPLRARAFGIETVYQDLALCDNLGATANVMLGQEPVRFGILRLLDDARASGEARRLIESFGAELRDYRTPVRRLSGGQRQAVALARALVHGHRMVILDEPTAALGVRQTRATLDVVRGVASQQVAVIMISHNLDDIFAVATRIVVFRLGSVVLDTMSTETSREEVVACMTGTTRSAASR